MKEGTLQIRTDAELEADLELIMEEYFMKNKSEMVRILIRKEAKLIHDKKKKD